MFCNSCGKEIGFDTKYCPFCGNGEFREAAMPAAAEPAPAAAPAPDMGLGFGLPSIGQSAHDDGGGDFEDFGYQASMIGGLDASFVVLIAYFAAAALGFVPVVKYFACIVPLAIYFADRGNKLIAFHALQAFLLGVAALAAHIVIAIIAYASLYSMAYYGFGAFFVANIIDVVVSCVVVALSLLAAIPGYRHQLYKIVFIGDLAEKGVGMV